MEGHLSQGGRIPGGAPFVGLDLQGSMRAHHQTQHPHNLHQQHHPNPRQGSMVHPSIHEGFPVKMGTMHNCDQTLSMVDYNKGEKCKNSTSDEDEPSYTEEGIDSHIEANRGKKGSPWQRVKWTDKMVRLLITAVSYIGEDTGSDCGGGGRRKFSALQKKGKWKSVSKVMAERGFHVSPQQCEDKFNDLNKRYKKLNDMLGRGTSCQVVENPALLDVIDYLRDKEKDDVRKILSSKHLFYEEMCSYHNGNRLHLPHDPALQHSLQEALRNRDDHDNDDMRRHHHDDLDEDDQDMETDEHDGFEENNASHGDKRGIFGGLGDSVKRLRQGQGGEDFNFSGSLNAQDCNKSSYSHPPIPQGDMNQVLPCLFDSPNRIEDKPPPTEIVKDVSDDSIEKLRKENAMLMRQADISELELQSLRKQVAKETNPGQNLSRQIISLKEERDALKLECQQLKSLRGRGEEVHASQKLQPEDKDTRVQLEAMKQELDREKKVRTNLYSQLHTTQDSNSELILVVKDLEDSLVKKNREIADLSSKLETEKNSKFMGIYSTRKTDEDETQNSVESLKVKIRELLGDIDTHEKKSEEQDMHIKRLTLDYDLLKQENSGISLKLDRNQEKLRAEMESERAGYIATIRELESQVKRSEETIEKQAHEFAECLFSIQELEDEVKALEMELEKQAKGFEEKLEDLTHAKDEQEQRATQAEEALRKTRWNSAATAERLQDELQKLSVEMASKLDENEKQTTKAMAEANELRVQNGILEEMVQKSNEQLELIKDQIDVRAKQVEQMSLELENKSKQLEYAKLHKEEKHEALTMKIQMLKAEIERLTEENSNITKQEEKLRGDSEQMKKLIAEHEMLIQNLNIEKYDLEKRFASSKQESEKMHEQLTNMRSLKDEKETTITHLKSEVDKLRTQYNESNNTLRKEALEKENLSKKIFQLQAGLKKEGKISTTEKKLKKFNAASDTSIASINNQRKSEDSSEKERNYKDLMTELTSLKERNTSMEKELKEMEERYSEISLRFAEVEGERQQLVMTVRNLRSNKKT